MADQKKGKYPEEPVTTQNKKRVIRLKRGKTRESAGKHGCPRLVLVLHFIGRENGRSFVDQSQNESRS